MGHKGGQSWGIYRKMEYMEYITLSKINQKENLKFHMFPFVWGRQSTNKEKNKGWIEEDPEVNPSRMGKGYLSQISRIMKEGEDMKVNRKTGRVQKPNNLSDYQQCMPQPWSKMNNTNNKSRERRLKKQWGKCREGD